MGNPFRDFTKTEWILWLASLAAVTLSGVCSAERDFAGLTVSLIGVTSLIFMAKGNVIGEFLTVFFSLGYAAVSYGFGYYGEMLIYLLLQTPAALSAIVSWLRHPFQGRRSEVEIQRIGGRKTALLCVLSAGVAVLFYFLLDYFHTENLIVSTVSVGTSFLALSLLVLRSPLYAAAFMVNDVVLIALWSFATWQSISYLPMLVCFVMFLLNDLYGFYNWRKMQKRQSEGRENG